MSNTAFGQHTARLTRSIQNVFSQATVMLLSDDPNATQLFEQLEQFAIASDQALLYLADADALLQLEAATLYPPSLPLSMSSTREEYWRSAYDTMRLQWAVMDKMRSRHSILKQAAADFWPATPHPPPAQPSTAAVPAADALHVDPLPAVQTAVTQDEQMRDGATEAAVPSSTEAVTSSSQAPPPDNHIAAQSAADRLTQPAPAGATAPTSNSSATPHPQTSSPTDVASSTDAMSDAPSTSTAQDVATDASPQQSTAPAMPQPDASGQIERPEPPEAARSVMDLTDD